MNHPSTEGNGAEPIDEVDRPELTVVCREQFEALHEEVSQLPEKYRGAGRALRAGGADVSRSGPTTTMPRGHNRRSTETGGVNGFAQRLMRRGLAPTAVLIGAALFGADAASAELPSVLVDSTVQAAMGFAATPILGLSEGVLRDHGADPAEVGGDSRTRGHDQRDHRLVGHSATDRWLCPRRHP